MKKNEVKRNFLKSFLEYLESIKAELAKVTWLSRQKVSAYVGIVVVVSIAITLYVWGVDVVVNGFFGVLNKIVS